MYRVKTYSAQENLIHTSGPYNAIQEAEALAIFYCNVADAIPRILKGRIYKIVDDHDNVIKTYTAE